MLYVLVIELSLEVLDASQCLFFDGKLLVDLTYRDLFNSGCDGISFLNSSIAFDFAGTRV